MHDHRDADGTILLLGAAGYIASALLPKLTARGYNVVVLDLFLHSNDSIQRFVSHPRVTIIPA